MAINNSTRREYRSLNEFLNFVKCKNIAPKTIIDVGAAWGTQELLTSFPDAYHILIEPNPRFEARLKQILGKYRGEYHSVALSDFPGKCCMRVIDGGEVGSSLMVDKSSDCIDVNVETLDGLLLKRSLERPILIKTDCQGYDMHVMRGGVKLCENVDIAVCEVNMFHPAGRPDLPDFGDCVITMRQLGFSVYDIVSYQTRPFDNALGYVDIVFVRDDGPLRCHHRWS